jgi:hypothetical protein
MKNVFFFTALISLFSCSHQMKLVERDPSSQHNKQIVLLIDLENKDLHVVEDAQTIGEFKIHFKDLEKNPQCITGLTPGKFHVLKKEIVHQSQQYGVICNYAITYQHGPAHFMIREDNGQKAVCGGHCGVLLKDGDGKKLFELLDKSQPKNIMIEIFR